MNRDNTVHFMYIRITVVLPFFGKTDPNNSHTGVSAYLVHSCYTSYDYNNTVDAHRGLTKTTRKCYVMNMALIFTCRSETNTRHVT